MDNEMKSRIKGLEQLGVPSDTSADLVSLMRALVEMTVTDDILRLDFLLAEMTVTDDIRRLDFLIDYSDMLLRCIQFDCFSRLIREKE